MGMFDSVFATCPECHKKLEFQSKAGPCDLKRYNHKSVPAEIAQDLNDYGTGYDVICCGRKWKLVAEKIPRISMNVKEIKDHEEEWD